MGLIRNIQTMNDSQKDRLKKKLNRFGVLFFNNIGTQMAFLTIMLYFLLDMLY